MDFVLALIASFLFLFMSSPGEAAVVVHEPGTHPGNRHNAMRAAELLNHHVIEPGQVFSFNGTLGSRTVARGFIPGHAISGRQNIIAVGGGVCRASTAVYQAALEAGLPIVERHPHNFRMAYAAPGMDATIWWPTVDLKFRNNTPHPQIMRTRACLERVEIVISPAIEIYHRGRPVGCAWLEAGKTTVYLRSLAEALQAVVEWRDGRAYINGYAVPPEVCRSDRGVLTVPLRDLAEMMGMLVSWEAGRVTIDTPYLQPGPDHLPEPNSEPEPEPEFRPEDPADPGA